MKTCAFTGHPQITLECAIPYERQAVRWPEALWKRNQYLVDHILRPDTLEVR